MNQLTIRGFDEQLEKCLRQLAAERQISLKRTTPRNMATAGRLSGTIIQALRWLGQPHVDNHVDHVIQILRSQLGTEDQRQLRKDLRYAPHWIAEILRAITDGDGDE